jgi:hypothetical protein
LRDFVRLIKEIASTLDFKPGSRGWAYILEQEVGLDKSEFDDAQRLITQCRKDGLLPLDIVGEDIGRTFDNIETVHDPDVNTTATGWVTWFLDLYLTYNPRSFWEYQTCYIQMLVEKADLLALFKGVCEEYRVPIANASGWADVSQRADMMARFKHWEKKGKACVLLYCGDHDPAGVNISTTLFKNIDDLSIAANWDPSNLVIDRFGLNYDFIKSLNLTWIDNLITSGRDGGKPRDLGDPKHPDHEKHYVQSYKELLLGHGESSWTKKCEANALVTRPTSGRDLCRKAIEKYISFDSIKRYRQDLEIKQGEMDRAIVNELRKVITKE